MAEKEYIDREAVLHELLYAMCGTGYQSRAMDAVHFVPAADVVEVVHARWNEDKYPFCNVCPECGLIIDRTCIKYNSGELNFCPNCGAKMDGGKDYG